MTESAFERALEEARRILDACANALGRQRLEEFTGLQPQLRTALAALAHSAPRQIDAAARVQLESLRRRSDGLMGFMLQRRQHASRMLDALAAASPRVRAVAMYRADGTMRPPSP